MTFTVRHLTSVVVGAVAIGFSMGYPGTSVAQLLLSVVGGLAVGTSGYKLHNTRDLRNRRWA